MSGLESVLAQRKLHSEEELLEFQRQFQQGQHAPSTKVIRVTRKPAAAAGAAADATANASASAASAAPAAPSAATPSSTAPTAAATATAPAATATAANVPPKDLASERKDRELESSDQSALFRTAQGVRERGHVAAPRVSFGAGSVAAKTTGFPATFKADLRGSKAPLPMNAPQAASAGGDAQPVKKKSLFAQQRDRMLAQQQQAVSAAAAASAASATPAAASAPAAAAPVVQREVVSLSSAALASATSPAALAAALSARNASAAAASSSSSSAPSRPAAFGPSALPESKGIHEENLLKLDEMSAAEIAEAQRELEKTLPPALLAMLRARRAGAGLNGGGSAAAASGAGERASFQPAPDASYPTPQQLNEYLLDESLLNAGDSDSDGKSDASDDEGIDEHGERVDGVAQRLRLDQQLEAYAARLESQQSIQAQAEKLEWSAPIQPSGPITFPETVQGYDNDAVIWNSWRVDFEGRFIAPGSASASSSSAAATKTTGSAVVSKSGGATVELADEYDDASSALYHHGDEADRPGYTMRELLHLARSTVMAQRTLSLQVIARVLARVRNGEYEYPAPVKPTPRALLSAMDAATEVSANEIPPFSHLLFSHLLYLNLCTLLRLSLDDNRNPAGVLATLHCFSAMLYHRALNELPLLDAQSSFKGHQMARRFHQAPSLAAEISKPEQQKKKQPQPTDDEEEDASGLRPDEKTDDDGLSDNARDEEMCARDLVVGLAHMQLLERLRYILEVYAVPAAMYRAAPPADIKKRATAAGSTTGSASDALAGLVLLAPCFQVLLAFAQHSPQAASKIFDTPRLKEVIVKAVECMASIVASGSASVNSAAGAGSSSLSVASIASTLHTALLLLGTLSQVHRDTAFFFLHPHGRTVRTIGGGGGGGAAGLFATLKKFIVLPNGVPGLEGAGSAGVGGSEASDEELALLLPLSIQSLHLWRVCLGYGLDIEAFMDHFPVLLGILSRTGAVVKRAVNVSTDASAGATAAATASEKVAELWLRQLRATVSVVEGLTLLFTPMSASAAALAKAESYSAPPADLSFEFSHIVHAVESVLSNLAAIWFAACPAAPEAASLRATMQETLASFLHLLATYYRVLPTQPSFQLSLLRVQIEKHTSMCFDPFRASPLLAAAEATVDQADQRGLAAIVEAYRSSCSSSAPPMLEFTNLPVALPRSDTRPLEQALNALFGLLRWQESLLTCTPLAAGSSSQPDAAAESKALALSLRRVLLSSRSLRSKLTRHFFATTEGTGECGVNRVSSRRFILSSLESEMVVTLFVLDRLDASVPATISTDAASSAQAFVPTSIQLFYARVLQSIPSLLRNGQQFLVSKLLADVLFNGPTLAQLARAGPCAREDVATDAPQIDLSFSTPHSALLRDLYAAFLYFPEELLVSTLLHTGSLLTPTLTPPLALASNPVANMDASTGRQFAVEIKLRQPVAPNSSSSSPAAAVAPEFAVAAWLLIPLKHCRFLSVQLAQSLGTTERTKMTRVLALARFLYLVDDSLGLLTPAPTPAPPSPSARAALHRPGAHPMSTLFLRAFLELFLLGSDVFADSSFEPLSARFLDRLLDSPAVRAEARRMAAAFTGREGPSSSSLSMGASIGEGALGAATVRNQGNEFVDLLSPEAERNAAAAASAASSSSSSVPLVPFFDFQSVTCFVSSNRSSLCTALWGQSFYPLFKELLQQFVADSMGDRAFGRVVTVLLHMSYPQDYRLAILREAREMMASLDCGAGEGASPSAAEGLPAGGKLPYIFPLESNAEIVQLHVAALAGAPPTLTAQRNPALYEVALHHVACWLFGWAHVSGSVELPATERVRRVRERMPMSTSPELMRDLMNYKFVCLETAAVTAPAAAAAVGSKDAPQQDDEKSVDPLVRALSPVQHAEIAAARAAAEARGPLVRQPDREYGLLCPCCHKHNSASASYCTGCGFALCPADEAVLPSNVFWGLVTRDPAAMASNEILSRDERALVVVDKFATSADPCMHVDCVPTQRITDLTELRAEHLPLLEYLYAQGLAALQREYDARGLAWLPEGVSLNDVLTAGYNEPVSVKQLHLHLVVPPFRHEKIMGYPRWHSHSKVVRDLRTVGRVVPYSEVGNEAESRAVYDAAIANNRRAQQWMKEAEERQTKAGAGAGTGAATGSS